MGRCRAARGRRAHSHAGFREGVVVGQETATCGERDMPRLGANAAGSARSQLGDVGVAVNA